MKQPGYDKRRGSFTSKLEGPPTIIMLSGFKAYSFFQGMKPALMKIPVRVYIQYGATLIDRTRNSKIADSIYW